LFSISFIFLSLENYGIRKLEAVFAVLITAMACSFGWMFAETKPSGKDLIIGEHLFLIDFVHLIILLNSLPAYLQCSFCAPGILVPKLSSRTIKQAVGLVGCVITPHNVFLHSALVQSRKIDTEKEYEVREALRYYSIESTVALVVPFMINLSVTTVFAKGFYGTKEGDNLGLENAGNFLQEKFGGDYFPILHIWGIGLLAAGTSSTITGTYAGQFIMGGFLNWRLKKWIRALITRSFAIVPTIVVALYFNASDSALDVLNEWLNVVQSVQIPFSLIPLITLVSKEHVMGMYKIGRRMKVSSAMILSYITFFPFLFPCLSLLLFLCGILMQILTWIVASLPIIINSYMLLDLFSSETEGVLATSASCVAVVAYASFIFYLILRGVEFPSDSLATVAHKHSFTLGKT
jgi:natural resistance-associated macrophage protein 2